MMVDQGVPEGTCSQVLWSSSVDWGGVSESPYKKGGPVSV